MVDIHSHIVWGVDDGPATLDDSLAMLHAALAAGTTDIVATPHLNPRYSFDPDIVLPRLADLQARCDSRLRLHHGCEFHLTFDNLDSLLDQPHRFTINGHRYLLLECPDSHIGRHTESVLLRLLDRSLVPVIAHPERNPALRKDLRQLESWVDHGCLLQLTALSITGGFGPSARAASFKLLERGLAHVVASDSHDALHRPPDMQPSFDAVASTYGRDAADVLFRESPQAIIDGVPSSSGRQLTWQPPAPWYKFWNRG